MIFGVALVAFPVALAAESSGVAVSNPVTSSTDMPSNKGDDPLVVTVTVPPLNPEVFVYAINDLSALPVPPS